MNANAICADASEEEIAAVSTSSVYGSLGMSSIDSQVASTEGVDDSATYFRFGWEKQQTSLIYGFGISGLLYDDDESFSQRVEDFTGDQFDEGSSASGIALLGEVGYRHVLNGFVQLDGILGLEYMMSSSRGIDNCRNCYSEDIEVDSGVYVSPRVIFKTDRSFYFGMDYRVYLSGDIENGVTLLLGLSR